MDPSLFRVAHASEFSLLQAVTDPPVGFDKDDSKANAKRLTKRLQSLQRLMWAERKQRLLVVLQSIDTGGKDGTIRSVFGKINAQSVKVHSFKKPTEHELAHDYLWRVHPCVPGDGEISIFNRSHYEDVLVVKVHGYASEERIQKRYEHIRNFENMLVDEGTTVIKILLHISKDEQKKRLESRLHVPEKNWKFQIGDLKEREHWDQYQEAFETMLRETSTEGSPWYVVPANNKRYRNELISTIVVETLESLEMRWPEPAEGLEDIKVV
jgi:PPK2 family polyphosphate:nucleotide phosphotransferase